MNSAREWEAEKAQNEDERARAFRSVFLSQDGQAVLKQLWTSTKLVQNAFKPGVDAMELAYWEGRRSVVQEILKNMGAEIKL